jgi:hypothetical protein
MLNHNEKEPETLLVHPNSSVKCSRTKSVTSELV